MAPSSGSIADALIGDGLSREDGGSLEGGLDGGGRRQAADCDLDGRKALWLVLLVTVSVAVKVWTVAAA